MEKEPLSNLELKVIEAMVEHGPLNRYDVRQYVKNTLHLGQKRRDTFQQLEDKGIIAQIDQEKPFPSYALTLKGRKINQMIKTINDVRKQVRLIVESS